MATVPVFYAPDRDPDWSRNPGVLTDCVDMIPDKKGSLRSWVGQQVGLASWSYASLGGPALHARSFPVSNGSTFRLVATSSRLLNAAGSWGVMSIIDVSLGGAAYAGSPQDWAFSQRGDKIYAVSKLVAPQVFTVGTSAAFAALGGTPPKAACTAVNRNFVMLGDCNNGASDLGDQWWCSGIGNDATWTPDPATECANGRLLETSGPITSLVPLRDSIIAYKANAIHVLDYVGTPIVWAQRVASHSVGCAAPHGVASVADAHYFIHDSNIWRFDGSGLRAIGDDVVVSFLNTLQGGNNSYALKYTHAVVDEGKQLIVWYCKKNGTNAGTFTHGLALNYATGKFGLITNPAYTTAGGSTAYATTCVMQGPMASDYPAGWGTYDSQSSITLVGSDGVTTCKFVTTGWGVNANASITTGQIGSDEAYTRVSRVTPQLLGLATGTPALANCTDYTRDRIHKAATACTMTADTTRIRWDLDASNRWHQFVLPMNGADLGGIAVVTPIVSPE
jgi:hypothetical protein